MLQPPKLQALVARTKSFAVNAEQAAVDRVSLKIEWISFAYLCVLLRALRGPALFYRKGRKGFAKGRKDEVLTVKLNQHPLLLIVDTRRSSS